MDILFYGAVVSVIVQAVKMVQQKYKPDLIPSEVYFVLALALGAAFSVVLNPELTLKVALETGFLIGFAAIGEYSGAKGTVKLVTTS